MRLWVSAVSLCVCVACGRTDNSGVSPEHRLVIARLAEGTAHYVHDNNGLRSVLLVNPERVIQAVVAAVSNKRDRQNAKANAVRIMDLIENAESIPDALFDKILEHCDVFVACAPHSTALCIGTHVVGRTGERLERARNKLFAMRAEHGAVAGMNEWCARGIARTQWQRMQSGERTRWRNALEREVVLDLVRKRGDRTEFDELAGDILLGGVTVVAREMSIGGPDEQVCARADSMIVIGRAARLCAQRNGSRDVSGMVTAIMCSRDPNETIRHESETMLSVAPDITETELLLRSCEQGVSAHGPTPAVYGALRIVRRTIGLMISSDVADVRDDFSIRLRRCLDGYPGGVERVIREWQVDGEQALRLELLLLIGR